MKIARRPLLGALLTAPIAIGCKSQPETPLAHLHGKGWVTGAYEEYGKGYAALETSTLEQTFDAYAVLAQRGIVALDGLQLREVPFHIRAQPAASQFVLERKVPSRLTFTAEMSPADRTAAEARWKRAREHIHTDYQEIQTLEWALTTLLSQLGRARGAIDTSREEQFRLTRQLGEVQLGELPFELPYQVTAKDYQMVVLLLVARLEEERERLLALESAVVSVGLTVRATDAGSASLASNIRKVLLSVVTDAEAAEPSAVAFPDGDDKAALIARGQTLIAEFKKSTEYQTWLEKERRLEIEKIGSVLAILDNVTGLPVSGVFTRAMTIWNGDADYMDYLTLAASIAPGGTELSKTLNTAVELSGQVRQAAKAVDLAGEVINGDASMVINTSTDYARKNAHKQLAFFEGQAELDDVTAALGQSRVITSPMPELPTFAGPEE